MNLVKKKFFKILIILIAVLFLSFAVLDSVSYARAGGGRSSGSSGFRSSGSSSGSTSTPYRSSTTQQPGTTQSMPQQSTGISPGKSLLYGIGGGLAGGMIGNMLFGSRGNAGQGWGGGGGFGFGDFLIILIILGIIYFMVKRYRAKKAMETSGGGGVFSSYANNEPAYDAPQYGSQPQNNTVAAGLGHIGSMDPSFNENAFKETVEDIFFKIQGAWTKRDLSGVRNLLTPEMLNTFQNDVNTFTANKQFNRLENIAVRQVDIVDAIQDQGQEYITIRFLASLLDYNVDEAGNTISGSSTDPVKFLEYWTFTRKVGERNWTLTAITQEQDYR